MFGVVPGKERDNLKNQLIFADWSCPGLFAEGD